MIVRVLAEPAIGIVASTVSVHKTPDKITRIWPFQYEPVAVINFGIDWESSSDEEALSE